MTDEPRKHPVYLILLAVSILGSVPFLFVGTRTSYVFGIPVWLWSSMGFTLGLSVVTAWGISRLWRDDRFE